MRVLDVYWIIDSCSYPQQYWSMDVVLTALAFAALCLGLLVFRELRPAVRVAVAWWEQRLLDHREASGHVRQRTADDVYQLRKELRDVDLRLRSLEAWRRGEGGGA